MTELMLGVVASAAIAAFAWRRGSLRVSGAVAAVAVGAAIFAGGGGRWFAALLAFFATSTLLSKVGRARKAPLQRDYAKGDTRDAWQVLANGGLAALCGVVAALSEFDLSAAFVGALATATADTWATELGPLSGDAPRHVLSGRPVSRGTSGAVTKLGLAASVAGGALVGAVFGLWEPAGLLAWIVSGALGGAAGSLADSVLGATLQAAFHCPRCHRRCERSLHSCGAEARHTGGLRWFGNDAVNFAATCVGATVAVVLVALLG